MQITFKHLYGYLRTSCLSRKVISVAAVPSLHPATASFLASMTLSCSVKGQLLESKFIL